MGRLLRGRRGLARRWSSSLPSTTRSVRALSQPVTSQPPGGGPYRPTKTTEESDTNETVDASPANLRESMGELTYTFTDMQSETYGFLSKGTTTWNQIVSARKVSHVT
jgi:hypothetical protein